MAGDAFVQGCVLILVRPGALEAASVILEEVAGFAARADSGGVAGLAAFRALDAARVIVRLWSSGARDE